MVGGRMFFPMWQKMDLVWCGYLVYVEAFFTDAPIPHLPYPGVSEKYNHFP